MVDPTTEFEYDVAISFLGPDLEVAQELSDILSARMNVFLFTDRQTEIAGSDGLETLSEVFGSQARLVIIAHREGWGQTPWTRVEETAIKNRGLGSGWDFLLLLPLEENPDLPPWIPNSQIWLGYAQYGLRSALPVVERMLEQQGGRAKPVTAASRALEFSKRAQWSEDRERLRRSDEGVNAATVHVTDLFDEIERAVSAAREASSQTDLAFKRHALAARLWSSQPNREGTTVTLRWSQQWANSLDQTGLHIRLWHGYASAAGEDIHAFEKPTKIAAHEFDFDFAESGRWVWINRTNKRPFDTAQLAEFAMAMLLNKISGG